MPLLFTENETNAARLFGAPNRSPFVKDGIHAAVVHGRADAVNWFAARDLAFHAVPTAMLDPEWAKRQLILWPPNHLYRKPLIPSRYHRSPARRAALRPRSRPGRCSRAG